jgi:hypothetical protein
MALSENVRGKKPVHLVVDPCSSPCLSTGDNWSHWSLRWKRLEKVVCSFECLTPPTSNRRTAKGMRSSCIVATAKSMWKQHTSNFCPNFAVTDWVGGNISLELYQTLPWIIDQNTLGLYPKSRHNLKILGGFPSWSRLQMCHWVSNQWASHPWFNHFFWLTDVPMLQYFRSLQVSWIEQLV